MTAHFLTFTTYGTWLHGDERGSVDRKQHKRLAPDKRLHGLRRDELKYALITLTAPMRTVVKDAIEFKGWTLRALNVRTNHVHCVVLSQENSGRVMNAIKARATRRVREAELIHATRRLWTSGGNKRVLTSHQEVTAAAHYVLNGQGADLPGV